MRPLVPAAGTVPEAASSAYPGQSPVAERAEARPLRVVLRADAGHTQGTGHVMRLLTLAEGLRARGHEVALLTAEIDIPWLASAVADAGLATIPSSRDAIDAVALADFAPDWLVVDSYLIPADEISAANDVVPVLLLADGDARGAQATLYLDQNLGAPPLPGAPHEAQLLGHSFALVRRAIAGERRDAVLSSRDRPRVLIVLGGTDPHDRTVDVARACIRLTDVADFTFVAPLRQHEDLRQIGRHATHWQVFAPTPRLPEMLGDADAVVTAGGTSAWDVATIGVPSVILAVVENQRASVRAIVEAGVALGLDVVDHIPDPAILAEEVRAIASDREMRERLHHACWAMFDGGGVERVVRALERHPRRVSKVPRA